ncbi:uncharacterized protein MYCFIDRAFT_80709 [Pseudocercospora fijiensis CIRAD86]|uniref:Amino acid permease/ SLC12A domain-containing protein n=1 Tax=Pseudocercospora fijiensis (strain CIRAD86) TaxID=383855 RepID=M3ALH9_PSEFD|nr:uncharacterized protein MYCFIDRAFT_80709 [Pseudocercospora fijiensis CIRAD86]EME78277.1 hypothetical protein MYCFIDRAFT_80709 [Pseudocercospora fijiensis CIRAD86]
MQRNFRLISTLAFTALVTGTWEVLLSASSMSLINGGTAGLFWSMIWCYTGQLFIVLSLAEMSSMVPVAGGPYQWVAEFASAKYRRLLSYCAGTLCSVGWQARFTAMCYMSARVILTLCWVTDPNFESKQWQRSLLTIGVAISVSSFNAFAAGHLSLAEGLFAICHVYAFIPIIIILWTLANKTTASEVFTQFTDNGGGWPSLATSVLVGQLPAMFIVSGSEAVVHIADEVEEPESILPRCIFWSFLGNMPPALMLLMAYLFSMGDLRLGIDVKHPFFIVFKGATDSEEATLGFTILVLSMLIMNSVSTMVATSRHLLAFGRDQALFFSPWISKVDPRLKVPLNAIYLTVLFTIVVSFVTITASAAFSTIIGLATSALMSSYLLSIGSLTLKRLRGEQLPNASWSLGKAGLSINCLALVYAAWALFWSFWPEYYHVDRANFNYNSVLFLAWIAFTLVLFVLRQRRMQLRPTMEIFPRWTPRSTR